MERRKKTEKILERTSVRRGAEVFSMLYYALVISIRKNKIFSEAP